MDAFEDVVDGAVTTPSVPPSFNDPFVIPIEGEVSANLISTAEETDETFEPNSFHPSDVSLAVQGLRARDESPGSPPSMGNDGNTDARAHI
jgi:hypothetical protein